MSSAFRNLNTRIARQWLEMSTARTYGFRIRRTCYNKFVTSSSLSSTTDVECDDKAILKDESKVETTNHNPTFDNEVSAKQRDKWWRYKFVKLHKRKFTADEKEQNVVLNETMENLPETELFGQLKRNSSPRFSGVNITHRPSRKFKAKTELDPLSNHVADPQKPNEYSYNNSANETSRLEPERSSLTEKGYSKRGIVRISAENKKWADSFGTLREDMVETWDGNSQHRQEDISDQEYSSDEEDERPHRRLADHGKHSPNWYGRQMKDFAEQGKIKEAIAVLDVWMLKNDRIRPNYYVFSILISILGKAGYTKKVFSVFNQMKKMGVEPKDQTYTSLFNACSNSPWPSDGLQRARNLRSLMVEKRYRPNLITYRAMIKAFGVCGDLHTAFAILDEATRRFYPDVKCFSFLLMACCSDKEAGFRHAIMVWRTLRECGLKPDLPLYNLLLRVIRDCGIGDINIFSKSLFNSEDPVQEIASGITGEYVDNQTNTQDDMKPGYINQQANVNFPSENKSQDISVSGFNREILDISSSNNTCSSENSNYSSSSESHQDIRSEMVVKLEDALNVSVPSVLESSFDNNTTLLKVDVNMLGTAEARLALVGGVKGILSNMESDGVQPDIKTLSQLVNSLPSNEHAELELIQVLSDKKIQPDVDFFNMLIRKRNLRHDYIGATELVKHIGQHKLLSNMTTFGCLAMGCRKREDGLQLLEDIQASGLSPNQAIFTILIFNSHHDFGYKLKLIKEMEEQGIKPTDKLLMYVEKQLQAAKKTIVDQERGKPVSSFFKSEYFITGYKKFMSFYGPWLKRTSIEKGEHPWSKFRGSSVNLNEQSDDKDEDSFVRQG